MKEETLGPAVSSGDNFDLGLGDRERPRKKFDQCGVRGSINRRRLQSNSQLTVYNPADRIYSSARQHTYGNHRSVRQLLQLHWGLDEQRRGAEPFEHLTQVRGGKDWAPKLRLHRLNMHVVKKRLRPFRKHVV